MRRKSPNIIYVGDVLEWLPWQHPARGTPGRWRVTAVHPIMKVDKA